MTDYSEKPLKNPTFSYTNQQNCNKFSRCHNYRTCRTCATIHKHKTIKKLTNHLEESIIKSYEYKYFIRFKNDDLKISVQEKNQYINLFMNSFIKSKRNNNFIIDDNSQYIFNKEISKSALGYNPHIHLILLTNKKFDTDNKQFKKLCNLYNISFHIEKVYKVNGSYKNSIQSMINYFNKFDKDTATIQRQTKLLSNEKSNRHSNLFRQSKYQEIKQVLLLDISLILGLFIIVKKEELARRLYNKIIEQQNKLLKQAKQLFKRNTQKTSAKNYLRLLKSLRKKKELINSRKARALAKLRKAQNYIF